MPEGGTLTIGSIVKDLDAGFVASHPGSQNGAHVALKVSDTGIGMDADTRARVFEPFFTTKPVGKGSGLGLATVYGIVKQSGGYIAVTSVPTRGSTFTVYLPQVPAPSAETAAAPAAPVLPSGGPETVLLVEDEPAVRNLARRALQRFGYRVLEAGNGDAAIGMSRDARDPIALLLTDIVMPGMSGRELAQRLSAERPSMRVLYTSGYPDAAGHPQELEATVAYLSKPYTPEDLARKVREVLDHR
jgi:CheY-like chemotaxis protein